MGTITKTIGTTGRDFATLALWYASLPANLVTDGNSYVGQCFNDSEFTSASNLLTISGNTTDATHTITLTTGTGQSFRDNASAQTNALKYNVSNGVGIRLTGTYASAVISTTANTEISNLQIAATAQPGAPFDLEGGGVADFLILEGLETSASNTIANIISSTIRNSLVVNRATSGSNVLFLSSGAGAYFVTIVSPSDKGCTNAIHCSYTGNIAENCAVFGCTNAVSGTALGTSTTNMTDVASPPAGFTGGKAYSTAQFAGVTNAAGDWKLVSGSAMVDAGTTDSTNGAHDIVGTSRPQGSAYDIGAWEFKSAVAGPTQGPLFFPFP